MAHFRGLTVFKKTNMRGCWIVASYHDPESITWSWGLDFRLFRSDENRVWPIVFRNGLRVPFIGYFVFDRQRKMMRGDT